MFKSLRRFQFVISGRNISTSTIRLREKCVNKVQLLGRVGSEPKVYGTEKRLVSFPFATHVNYKVSNEDGSVTENSRTSWHLINIRIPSLQEYVLNYVFKGTRLLLNGRLEYSQTKTKEGTPKDLAVIVVDDVIIMTGPRADNSEMQTGAEQTMGSRSEQY